MKLWEKGKKLNKLIEDFTVGDDYIIDREFISYDCAASIAHAKTLEKAGFLTPNESTKIIKELENIKKNGIEIKKEDEDLHTAIENRLVKRLGNTGKKIHAGRSRNDQIMAAIQLWGRDKIRTVHDLAVNLCTTFNKFSKANPLIMPGYTHMQKAMPSSLQLLLGSYIESLFDDLLLLKTSFIINNSNPLGSAAGYGTSLNLDRNFTAKLLGFKENKNYIYAQNRPKLISTLLLPLCSIMKTLDKIASDLLVFTANEFDFFSLPSAFCTGSSIMPQKKNYDVLELMRGKSAIVHSSLYTVDMLDCKLISGYNRDFQLAKKPLIEAFNTTIDCLKIMDLVYKNLKVNKSGVEKAVTPELFAADSAYEFVKKGDAFRDAYKKTAKNLKLIKIPDDIYKDRIFLKFKDYKTEIDKIKKL
ncbi:MAG: argininosuccinate lyase [Armatimonadota bacterium]